MLGRAMIPARRARYRAVAPSIAAIALFTSVSVPALADAPKPASTVNPADAAKEKREKQARAVDLHNEAKALYERGLYRRAITKLEAALTLDPDGKELVYNLALIHEKLAEPDLAETYYLRYIDMETDPKLRDQAQAAVKRIQGAKDKLKADIEERAAPSATPTSTALSPAATGEPAPPSRAPSPMVLVIGGVAVAALGVGIGFGVSALATQPVHASTGPGVTAYDLEMRARSAHTQAVVADLAIGSSVVEGLAASLLYLLETRSPRSVAPAPSAPAPQGNGAPTVARGPVLLRVEAPF